MLLVVMIGCHFAPSTEKIETISAPTKTVALPSVPDTSILLDNHSALDSKNSTRKQVDIKLDGRKSTSTLGGLVKTNNQSTKKSNPSVSSPIDLNTATVDELVSLPGIGRSRAQAIVRLRQQKGGRFKRTKEIRRIRGIGRSTWRDLRKLVTVN